MIQLPLSWLVFTALFLFLAWILVAWIGTAWARRRRERAELRRWTRCPVCALRFHRGPGSCPQCGAPASGESVRIF